MEYQVIQNVKKKKKYKQYNIKNKHFCDVSVCVHTGAICMQICLSVTNDKSSYSL